VTVVAGILHCAPDGLTRAPPYAADELAISTSF
jgi:hypothetical protein